MHEKNEVSVAKVGVCGGEEKTFLEGSNTAYAVGTKPLEDSNPLP